MKGGAIYYDFINPVIDEDTTLENNTAFYGNDLASYPVRIGLINSRHSDVIKLSNIASGLSIESGLELVLLDYDDQVFTLDNSSLINILSLNPDASVRGVNVAKVNNGVVKFDDLIFTSQPGSSNIQFTVSSNSIDKHKIGLIYNDEITQSHLHVDFRH